MSRSTITQRCPSCRRSVQATLRLERKDHRLVADESTCPDCGRVLWLWRYEKQSNDASLQA